MIKKIIALTLILVIMAAMPAFADQVTVLDTDKKVVKSVVFVIGSNEYFVDGKTPGTKMDAAAFIQNDRTYVPVRYLAYALGLTESDVKWDAATRKVTLIGPATLELVIDVPSITTNGVKKAIDVAPVIKDSRTYLPARYVAEGLGYEVAWDAATKTVICWPKGEPKPDISAVKEYLVEQNDPVPVDNNKPGKVDGKQANVDWGEEEDLP
ncbi:MAG: copper amine oxidase N-terminal domain-containing protein [Firmicutes bacterium]|nr:copper amine oxidase N-terminal domain-containing protein [Bacillota bacterium]